MNKKNKNNIDESTLESYEANKKIRRDWGAISPAMKVFKSKKKIIPRKSKYKGADIDG